MNAKNIGHGNLYYLRIVRLYSYGRFVETKKKQKDMNKTIYVTFTYRGVRYAVSCDNDEQANDIAMDVNSLANVRFVYIRHSDKPRGADVMSVNEYKQRF